METVRRFIKIRNFSTAEVTGTFNHLCKAALGLSPVDVKKSLLGIRSANADTKVSITHLALLIEKYELDMELKVNYLEEVEENVITPNFETGLKRDIIHDSMEEQKDQIKIDVATSNSDKKESGGIDASNIPIFKVD